MLSNSNFLHLLKKPGADRKLQLSKAARSLEIIKHISHFSPVLKSSSPRGEILPKGARSPIIGKLKELSNTKDSIMLEIHESLGLKERPNRKNSFHKAKDFIEKKLRIKKNVRENKFKSSEKLKKLKSIIEFEQEPDGKNFLSHEDMQNELTVEFLSLNKRQFGQSPNLVPVLRSSKKKLSKNIKLNSRCPSLPDLGVSKPLKLDQSGKKSIDLNASKFLNNYIHSEMKKVWPSEEPKGKFLLKLSNF